MSDLTLRESEPVTLPGLLTAAATATVNLLALIFTWSGTVVAAVNISLAAWIAVLAFIVRSKVVSVKALDQFAADVEAQRPPEFP